MNPSAEDIIETTRKILSQPEFQQKIDSDKSIIHQFFEHLFQAIPQEIWTLIFYLLAGIFVFGFVWLIIKKINFIFAKKLQVPSSASLSTETSTPPDPNKKFLPQENPRVFLERGDTKGAIKALHNGLLTSLENKKLLAKRKWKTNSHYTEECKTDLKWQKILYSINQDFEQLVYGNVPLETHHIETQINLFEAEACK